MKVAPFWLMSVCHTFVKKKVEKLMCLKCVLGPQEPLKKSHVLLFFLPHRSVRHTSGVG